ncbi:MAG: hypothetical protein JWN44_733 [Myxococcales bacterium]|nr:hypothetical protein [Myxococcales bacterium]
MTLSSGVQHSGVGVMNSVTLRAMPLDDRKLRAIVGLATFRSFLGVALAAAPWISGAGLDGYGATQLGGGVAIVAMAPIMHRRARLRWIQGALALSVFFLPFAFADTTDIQIYVAVLIGKLLLISAIVSPDIFRS